MAWDAVLRSVSAERAAGLVRLEVELAHDVRLGDGRTVPGNTPKQHAGRKVDVRLTTEAAERLADTLRQAAAEARQRPEPTPEVEVPRGLKDHVAWAYGDWLTAPKERP